MIFDFEPWQLDIDIDLTKQLYRELSLKFIPYRPQFLTDFIFKLM